MVQLCPAHAGGVVPAGGVVLAGGVVAPARVRRQPPAFPPDIWNVHAATINGSHKYYVREGDRPRTSFWTLILLGAAVLDADPSERRRSGR